jgi:allophanate hydrolase
MPHAADEATLLTIADWRRAWLGGAAPGPLLQARWARLFGPAAQAAAHAWITPVAAPALQARLDELQALAAGRTPEQVLAERPLFGVPFAAKDNIDAEGFPTTAACPAHMQWPAQSATVVRRLLDSGAVLIGKTNLDQFATGLVGTRSPYGAPASVFSAAHVSGGSSSGSAVAVASGEVAFALGTDTAGSGRVPAGFNHLVGLKPTPGRVSTAGVLPACRTLDCVSVFAHTVEDAAQVLALIEGADEADDYSRFAPGPAAFPRPLRVAVPRAPRLAADYAAPWAQALQRLQALGAQVLPIDDAPLQAVAALLYDGPWVAERLAAVQAALGADRAATARALDPAVAAVLDRGRHWTAVDAFRAGYALRRQQRAADALWHGADLLMVPTAPGHPRHDEVAADPLGANAALGTYTNFVNLLGWSALALPSGFTAGGLPFGVTFVAPGGADAALADWGRSWQRAAALPLAPMAALAPMAGADAGSATSATPETPETPETSEAPDPHPWPATAPTLPLTVVGAHMSDLPLNAQLTDLGAVLLRRTATAPLYRLFALPATQPPRPALLRVGEGGHAIEAEVWSLPMAAVGRFLAQVPSPLALGTLVLADGSRVHGFLCEPFALEGALDVSRFGGWRAYLSSL